MYHPKNSMISVQGGSFDFAIANSPSSRSIIKNEGKIYNKELQLVNQSTQDPHSTNSKKEISNLHCDAPTIFDSQLSLKNVVSAHLSFDSRNGRNNTIRQGLNTNRNSMVPLNSLNSINSLQPFSTPRYQSEKTQVKSHRLPKIKSNSTQPQPLDLSVPRRLKYTNNPAHTNVDAIRVRLRKQMISKHTFDSQLEQRSARRYYATIYQPNEPVFCTVTNPSDKKMLLGPQTQIKQSQKEKGVIDLKNTDRILYAEENDSKAQENGDLYDLLLKNQRPKQISNVKIHKECCQHKNKKRMGLQNLMKEFIEKFESSSNKNPNSFMIEQISRQGDIDLKYQPKDDKKAFHKFVDQFVNSGDTGIQELERVVENTKTEEENNDREQVQDQEAAYEEQLMKERMRALGQKRLSALQKLRIRREGASKADVEEQRKKELIKEDVKIHGRTLKLTPMEIITRRSTLNLDYFEETAIIRDLHRIDEKIEEEKTIMNKINAAEGLKKAQQVLSNRSNKQREIYEQTVKLKKDEKLYKKYTKNLLRFEEAKLGTVPGEEFESPIEWERNVQFEDTGTEICLTETSSSESTSSDESVTAIQKAAHIRAFLEKRMSNFTKSAAERNCSKDRRSIVACGHNRLNPVEMFNQAKNDQTVSNNWRQLKRRITVVQPTFETNLEAIIQEKAAKAMKIDKQRKDAKQDIEAAKKVKKDLKGMLRKIDVEIKGNSWLKKTTLQRDKTAHEIEKHNKQLSQSIDIVKHQHDLIKVLEEMYSSSNKQPLFTEELPDLGNILKYSKEEDEIKDEYEGDPQTIAAFKDENQKLSLYIGRTLRERNRRKHLQKKLQQCGM